jgi:hypothetical protein
LCGLSVAVGSLAAKAVVVVLPMMVAPAHDRCVGARPESPVDRRAHFGRKIRSVDDVLDPDRDAAQRPGVLRAGVFGMAHKRADGFFVGADRFERKRDGGIRGEIAGIDAALKFDEGKHGHRFLWRAYRFYGPDVDRTSGCGPRVFVMAGLVAAMLALGMVRIQTS